MRLIYFIVGYLMLPCYSRRCEILTDLCVYVVVVVVLSVASLGFVALLFWDVSWFTWRGFRTCAAGWTGAGFFSGAFKFDREHWQ